MKGNIEISLKEYREKRFEITRDLMISILTFDQVDRIHDNKQRQSIVFLCMQFADTLLTEMGYFPQSKTIRRDLSSILSSGDSEDE